MQELAKVTCRCRPRSGLLTVDQIHEHLPPGISIASANDLKEWQMDIRVLDNNPLYQNETYRLKFAFSNQYPIGGLDCDLARPG